MRINTRLSPRVQLQFRVPERRSLGTRLAPVFIYKKDVEKYNTRAVTGDEGGRAMDSIPDLGATGRIERGRYIMVRRDPEVTCSKLFHSKY